MTLCEQLKEIIEGYFHQFPHTSINGLAKKSGVGATTLRRILNLSLKGDPAPHTVLNIVSTVKKEKRLPKLLKMFSGPLGELLTSSFSIYAEELNPRTYDSDLNEALRDEMKYFIYKLASNRTGVKKDLLIEMYGKLGLEHLEELIVQGHLIEQEGVIHAKEKWFSLDATVSLNHVSKLLEFIKPEEVKQGLNLFYTFSESVNSDGIRKIKEIQREAAKKINDILQSPYFEGEIPYFSVNACDTLLFGEKK